MDLFGSNFAPLLAVTGSQRPYIFDLPHLLSLPNGFEFRFRYRHRWVEKALVSAIASDPGSLVGREIVLLFHSQPSRRIIPIRRGTVIALESIGPMIFVRFRVGDFVKIDLDIANLGSQTVASAVSDLSRLSEGWLGEFVAAEAGRDLSRPLPEGGYLRSANAPVASDPWDRSDPPAAWARLVAILHSEPELSGIPFFYVLGFRTERGAAVASGAVKNRFSVAREEIYGFSLVESERYRMRVIEWCEPPQGVEHPRIEVKCDFNAEQLALEGSSNLVVGRYDVVEFTFSALQPGYSELSLRAKPRETEQAGEISVAAGIDAQPDGPTPAWTDWPAIFVARVPLLVKPRARRLLAPGISLAVGLALYLRVVPALEPRPGRLVEVLSLGFLLFGYGGFGRYLERLFKLSAGMEKLKGGPREWARTAKDD